MRMTFLRLPKPRRLFSLGSLLLVLLFGALALNDHFGRAALVESWKSATTATCKASRCKARSAARNVRRRRSPPRWRMIHGCSRRCASSTSCCVPARRGAIRGYASYGCG